MNPSAAATTSRRWSSGSATAATAAWSSRCSAGSRLAEAESLGALRATGTTCIGLLIDPATWLNLPEPARAEADRRARGRPR